MGKKTKARSYSSADRQDQPEPELTGIAKAAQELSVAVEEFDRQAATWSKRKDLVLT